MRVLIYGNAPYVPSGYGTQAALLGRMLRAAGHEAAFAAFHGLHGTPLNWDDTIIYPGSTEDPWALDVLPGHYRHFRADLLITLMDAWVLDPNRLAGMNVAHWMPVDCTPLGAMDRRVLDAGGGRIIAMSRFGEKQFADAGYDALYAPHALDLSVWAPLERRDEARETLGLSGKFVVGINAANQDPFRKAFGEQFTAFAAFSERHDDAVLLIHSRAETRQGANLTALIRDLGVEARTIMADQYLYAAGLVSEPQMVSWHGITDVLLNCSYGEGFGLAVLQSQACGTPVIVNDCSSMTELCGAGWKVIGQRLWNRGHDAWWTAPDTRLITEALEDARARASSLRERAREFALAYDARKVYEDHWAAILKELAPLAGEGTA